MRFAYAAASYALLIVLVDRGADRYPFFLAHCAATAFWLPVYQSHNEEWLSMWQTPMYVMLVGLRFAAAAEAVWRLAPYGSMKVFLRGSTLMAIGWVLIAWRIEGDLSPIVQARNYIQVGTFVFLGLPMWMCCKYRAGCDNRHGLLLLALLGVNATISWLLLAGVHFSHAQWVAVDTAANAAAICFCLLRFSQSNRSASHAQADL